MIKYRYANWCFSSERFWVDIALRMRELGLDDETLASLCGLKKGSIYHIRRGNQEYYLMPTFLVLCNVLELNPTDYFELDI